MNFSTFTHQLSCGNNVQIREAIPEDAEKLLFLKLQYLKNTSTIPLYDYEYANTIEQEEELISKLFKSQNSLLLVAECQNQLVGNIDLTGNQRKKLFHTAVIGMGIHTEWQNKGLGTLLLNQCVQWSIQNKFLQLIWLEVYDTNLSGKALYTKLGFRKSGELVNFFNENGNYIPKIIMSLPV